MSEPGRGRAEWTGFAKGFQGFPVSIVLVCRTSIFLVGIETSPNSDCADLAAALEDWRNNSERPSWKRTKMCDAIVDVLTFISLIRRAFAKGAFCRILNFVRFLAILTLCDHFFDGEAAHPAIRRRSSLSTIVLFSPILWPLDPIPAAQPPPALV